MRTLYLVLALVILCGCSDGGTVVPWGSKYEEAEGASWCYLTWEMHDNDISDDVRVLKPVTQDLARVHMVTQTDNNENYPNYFSFRGNCVELPYEYDSCYPERMREFFQAQMTNADFKIVHFEGHGIIWNDEVIGMGPDYDSPIIPDQATVASWAALASSIEGLGVDIVILDGCNTFNATAVELFAIAGVKYLVGTTSNIYVNTIIPCRIAWMIATNDFTPEELCDFAWGGMPLAFAWTSLHLDIAWTE